VKLSDVTVDTCSAAGGGFEVVSTSFECVRCALTKMQGGSTGLEISAGGILFDSGSKVSIVDSNVTNVVGGMMGGVFGSAGGILEISGSYFETATASMGGAFIAGSGITKLTMCNPVLRDIVMHDNSAFSNVMLFDGPTTIVSGCRFEASPIGWFYVAKSSLAIDNSYFEPSFMDAGSLAIITQGAIFRMTSSTVISRTSYTGNDDRRGLIYLDDGYEGFLQLSYTRDQVKEMPLAVIEITDSQITSACRSYVPEGSLFKAGLYPPIFKYKENPSDPRLNNQGPFALRATTITLEYRTANDFATTFGLLPSGTATCATNSICGVEAGCQDMPMFVDAATGAVSGVRTTAVCSCGGPMVRYAMAEGVASEPIRALVPYEDGCVTPTAVLDHAGFDRADSDAYQDHDRAGVGDAHTSVEAVWQRYAGATRAVGGGERTHTLAHNQRLSLGRQQLSDAAADGGPASRPDYSVDCGGVCDDFARWPLGAA